jgi:WG repeat protein
MHSLPYFSRWMNHRGAVAFAVVLALFVAACGRQETSEQTSGTDPLFSAPLGTAWGFINNRGKTVIPPRFEAAQPFSQDLAAVKREGRWGYIDRKGSEVIPIRYRGAQDFRNGVAIVDAGLPEHAVGLIDTSGAWVTQPLFRSLSAADGPGGLLLGQKEPAEGFSFYDRSGNLVLGPYFLAFPFAQGRARVKTGARAGSDDWIIDASGTLLPKKPLVLDGIRFSGGLIAVRQDRKLGYMDLDGNIAIEPRYDQGGEFAEGLAAVQLEGHWTFIDKSGAAIAEFPAGIAFAEPLSDGLSLVSADRDQSGRKFGYVDRNGHWAIKPNWDDAQPFHDGLAYVGIWKGEKTAYIDHKGKTIWEGRSLQP